MIYIFQKNESLTNRGKKRAAKKDADAKDKRTGHASARLFRIFFFSVLILCFLGILVVGGTNLYVIHSVRDRIITVQEAGALAEERGKFQCAAVLGAAIRNGKPSVMLADRLMAGISLHTSGAADALLFTGDNGQNDYNEVAVMKQFAIDQKAPGVDESVIYLDYAGFSTYESMYRMRDVFLVERGVVVTQKYHLYRALYTAKAMGVDVYGVAAAPSAQGQAARDVREILARTKDFFYVLFDIKPTFLGEPVPLVLPSTQAGDAVGDPGK